jgi:hypothetical protein
VFWCSGALHQSAYSALTYLRRNAKFDVDPPAYSSILTGISPIGSVQLGVSLAVCEVIEILQYYIAIDLPQRTRTHSACGSIRFHTIQYLGSLENVKPTVIAGELTPLPPYLNRGALKTRVVQWETSRWI